MSTGHLTPKWYNSTSANERGKDGAIDRTIESDAVCVDCSNYLRNSISLEDRPSPMGESSSSENTTGNN